MHYLFLFLLLFMPLHALKIELKEHDNSFSAKIHFNRSTAHLQHLNIKLNEKTVVDAYLSKNLPKRALFHFTFNQPLQDKVLTVNFSDKNGIQRDAKLNVTTRAKTDTKIKTTATKYDFQRSFKQALLKEYAQKEPMTTDKLKITLPSRVSNSKVPLHIESSVAIKSIAIYKSNAPSSFIALFKLAKADLFEVDFNFLIDNCKQDIVVIAEDAQGRLLKTSATVENTFTPCNKHSYTPLYECHTLKDPLEKSFCEESQLIELDQQLQTLYTTYRTQDFLDASKLLLTQKEQWMQRRIDRCPKYQSECLVSLYKKQITLLKDTYEKIPSQKSYKRRKDLHSGNKGLQQLIFEKKIRKATPKDLKAWADAKLRSEDRHLPQSGSNDSFMALYPFGMATPYLILQETELPEHLPRATFFIPADIPYPLSNPSHSRIYEFGALTCNGIGCAIDKPFYKKREKSLKNTNPCLNKQVHLDAATKLFVAGDLRGMGLSQAIDYSGEYASQFSVKVNMPQEKVALLLSARSPSLWKIKWSKGTMITHVFLTGKHHQVISGLPKETPITRSFEVDGEKCYLDHLWHDTLSQVNPLTQNIYGRDADKVFFGRRNNVLYGKIEIGPLSSKTSLYSLDTPKESLYIKELGLGGIEGIEALLREKKIRKATQADVQRWAQKLYEAYLKKTDKRSQTKTKKDFVLNFLYRGYIIKTNIRIPAGYAASYFLEEGVSYPIGKKSNSVTIYDFNTLGCSGRDCNNYP